MNKFDYTDVGIYFPPNKTDICSIHISRAITVTEFENVLNLFDSIIACYQADIPPRLINSILDLNDNPIELRDIFFLIKDTQSEIARKIGKSKQLISNLKNGNVAMTLENLAALMRVYPLLPWKAYIDGCLEQ